MPHITYFTTTQLFCLLPPNRTYLTTTTTTKKTTSTTNRFETATVDAVFHLNIFKIQYLFHTLHHFFYWNYFHFNAIPFVLTLILFAMLFSTLLIFLSYQPPPPFSFSLYKYIYMCLYVALSTAFIYQQQQ